MAKFNDRQLPKHLREAIWDEFCSIVSKLKTQDDARRFLSDLLNRQERLMLARRLQIAALLDAEFTYDDIVKILGVGKNTVARVQRWLNFGRDGYKRAIKILNAKDKKFLQDHYCKYYDR